MYIKFPPSHTMIKYPCFLFHLMIQKQCHSVYDDLKTDIPTKPENIFVCVTKIQNIVAHLFSSKWINLVMDQLLQLLNSLIVHINLSNERWHGASSVSRPSYNTGPIIIIIVMNLFVFQEWTTKWYTHVSKRRTLLLDRDKKKRISQLSCEEQGVGWKNQIHEVWAIIRHTHTKLESQVRKRYVSPPLVLLHWSRPSQCISEVERPLWTKRVKRQRRGRDEEGELVVCKRGATNSL